ncbi:hypothetical protein IEI94_08775 [Halomonas sp. ML-15]|uniref:hypothetical protein n=1 Tax=Halomonas sp. ML-15 TaxID=2773305 RepID=UPI0017471406|nr:hypothetical protein [Halomonas sp. ML-15]MBD3895941.1 hypothetical protein [Halomonas sp. ML-15]
MPECRLCKQERDLCKSHIFPEYMYSHCYDDNHSFIEFNAEEGKYNKRRRKGIYENLLCKKCEETIQRYEGYGKLILYDDAKPKIEASKQPYTNESYDYRLFKLFVLSLLWRSSISTQDSFKLVSLGKYEEELRMVLLDGLALPVNNYPIYLYQTHISGEPSDGVFMEIYPSKSKFDGKTIYQFVADGMFFFVGIGVNTLRTFKNGSWVNQKRLQIGYDELTTLSSLVDVFVRLHHQGKFSVYETQT